MQIIEIKNNFVKIGYDINQDNLVLSGFVVLKDDRQSFVGQIIHLEANSGEHFAVLKLLLNFDSQGLVTSYNGSIPALNSVLLSVTVKEIMEIIPAASPIIFGQVAQQNAVFKLDKSALEKMLVCVDNNENKKLFTKNLSAQLSNLNKKLLIIDLVGDFEDKIVAGKDFKLPLNYETINFIYEKGLDNANDHAKALIQEVFLEVQDYIKTLPDKFLPFELFKNVVDEQYQSLNLIELVLLKNKLLKYKEAGIFAQEKNEFESLKQALKENMTTVFDLSTVDEKVQREMISYAYKTIQEQKKEFYVVVNITNLNSDKKLLKQIFSTQNAVSIILCPYSYKYLTELKQLSKTLIFFTPIQQQSDFADYNAFLSKLNSDEFIIWGKVTYNMPFIIKLDETPQNTFEKALSEDKEIIPEAIKETAKEEVIDEQIKKDVDEFYMTPKTEQIVQNVAEEEIYDEEFTEDDLDFIDELNSYTNQEAELAEKTEEFVQEKIQEIEKTEEQEKFEEKTSFAEKLVENFIQDKPKNEIEVEPPPVVDILPASAASSTILPVYPAETDLKESEERENFVQGDLVFHEKYGKGIIEKMINYGSKTLCSIQFDNVGRRLLDPSLADIKKLKDN